MRIALTLLVLSCAAGIAPAGEIRTVRVGTDAPDLAAAVERSRGLAAPKRIVVPAGEWFLTAPVVLDGRDVGLEIVGEGDVRILGGCRLGAWTAEDGGVYSAEVPAAARPRMLLIGNELTDPLAHRKLARFPDEGRFEHLTRFDVPWLSSKDGGWARPPTHAELTEMIVNPHDLPADFDAENADVNVFHVWDESLASVVSCDLTTGRIVLASELANPAGAHGQREYAFLNTRFGLTHSGTWYHDRRRNRVVTRPYGRDAGGMFEQAWVPLVENAFKITEGADGVKIVNLGIFLVNAPVANAGLRGQGLPGAIDADRVSDLTLRGLRFAACAGNAIRLDGVRNFKIADCRIDRIGGSGIAAEGSMPGEISGCEVSDVGQLYASSVGIMAGGRSQFVWIVQGRPEEVGSVRIADNLVDGVPYCGIVCSGAGNVIERNEVIRTMRVLNDGSAIYCSRGAGSRIVGNFVSDAGQGNGIYLDEGCCHCDVGGNVVLRAKTAVCCHIARNNDFHDNVMAADGDMMISVPRSKNLHWRDSVLYASGRIRFSYLSACCSAEEILDFDNVFACSKGGDCLLNEGRTAFPPWPGLKRADPLVGIDEKGCPFFREGSPTSKRPKVTFCRKSPLKLPDGWSVFTAK